MSRNDDGAVVRAGPDVLGRWTGPAFEPMVPDIEGGYLAVHDVFRCLEPHAFSEATDRRVVAHAELERAYRSQHLAAFGEQRGKAS